MPVERLGGLAPTHPIIIIAMPRAMGARVMAHDHIYIVPAENSVLVLLILEEVGGLSIELVEAGRLPLSTLPLSSSYTNSQCVSHKTSIMYT